MRSHGIYSQEESFEKAVSSPQSDSAVVALQEPGNRVGPQFFRLCRIPEFTCPTCLLMSLFSSGIKSPPRCWLTQEKTNQELHQQVLVCFTTKTHIRTPPESGKHFFKHTLNARYYSELFGLKSQGWLSMIFPFWLNMGSYQVCWNKNESDNVSSDCR